MKRLPAHSRVKLRPGLKCSGQEKTISEVRRLKEAARNNEGQAWCPQSAGPRCRRLNQFSKARLSQGITDSRLEGCTALLVEFHGSGRDLSQKKLLPGEAFEQFFEHMTSEALRLKTLK